MSRFRNGLRAEVINRMAHHAVRDQQSLIEALSPRFGGKPDAETAEQIQHCRDNIADYRRLARQAQKDIPS